MSSASPIGRLHVNAGVMRLRDLVIGSLLALALIAPTWGRAAAPPDRAAAYLVP